MSLVSWLYGLSSTLERGVDQQLNVLDLQCISWILQISLDKSVHLSTLKHLVAMKTLVKFDSTLITSFFNTFAGCISIGVNNHEVVIMQGLEELARVSALCFFSTVSHLLVMDPTPRILEDVNRQYLKAFPAQANFHGHKSYHTVNAAHCLLVQQEEHRSFSWSEFKPSPHEHTVVVHNLVMVSQFKYQGTQQGKVPCLILRFTFHSLSLDPSPSPPVIADSLSIIAIDLGCDMSETGTTTLDERYVPTSQITTILTLD